jgi:hypothetical protein
VDIDAWATAKEEGSWHEAPPDLPSRHRAWKQSSFRFVDNFRARSQRQAASRKMEPFGPTPPNTQHPGNAFRRIMLPQNQQTAAQPSNSHPLPSQPSTPEEP